MNGPRLHWAHLVLETLTRIDTSSSRDAYNRLRTVYNSYCPPDSLPVPPLEEWQGLSSICEVISCRYESFSEPNRLLAVSGVCVELKASCFGAWILSVTLNDQNMELLVCSSRGQGGRLLQVRPC